jgi:hypothetical protein
MSIFDGKYDFAKAGAVDPAYQFLEGNLRTPEFVQLAKPFIASVNRVRSFFELPLQLIFWSGIVSQVKLLGRYHAGVHPEDDSRDAEGAVQRSISETYERLVRNPDPDKILAFSSNALGSMIGDTGGLTIDYACQGVEAAFAAIITTAYATFETLASDLWICAVNRHTLLADNWTEKNKEKQLTMKDISGHGYDLSKTMGTLLHLTGKISFQSLKEIRTAYSQAFKAEFDSVFEGTPDLVRAEKIRHLFSHRGGLIDRKFKDEMSDFDDCKNMVIAERLRLTGPVTGKLFNACVSSGTALLVSVDKWSLTHL